VGDKVALQGNLDPAILFASPEQIRPKSTRCWTPSARAAATCSTWATAFRSSPRPENVAAMVEAVHSYSKAQRAS
jgi:uroporphyrinogen decarboxylase